MESEIRDFAVELEAEVSEPSLKSFRLYEEFSGKSIAEIVRLRAEKFGKSDDAERKQQRIRVEQEIVDFRNWLMKVKGLEERNAHYYAVSLKSLLLGMPFGIAIASLFSRILDRDNRQS
ncbi:MAG: hypothetical protein QW840_02110 [Candidatus Bathyarchaeia archaeon]